MKIGIRNTRRSRERSTLTMATLIDVVFLLLSFFLVTSMVTSREDRLSPNLQVDHEVGSGEQQDFVPQVLEVLLGESGPVFRLAERDFQDRSSLITALKELPKDPGLFVRVHSGPTVADAAFAVQCGRDSGFTEVTYVPAKE